MKKQTKQKQGKSKENMIRECTEQTMLPVVENTSPLQQKSKETRLDFMVNTKGKEPSSLDFDSYIELLNGSPGFYGKSNMKKSSSSSSFSVGMHNSNQESFASSIGNSLPHFSTTNATDSDMYGSTYHVLYGEPLINLPVSNNNNNNNTYL